MLKVAVLMLAHKNKDQIERLISVLQHPSIDIYIHLDKKSELSPSDFQHPNVRFTDKRIDITLFDFSMIEAEMELIRTASSYEKYAYYILLSGQCYPLRHINNIYDYLCENYPKPLIEIISPKIVTKFKKQFQYSYAMKKTRTKYSSIIRKKFPSIGPYLWKLPGGFIFLVTLMKTCLIGSPQKRLNGMNIDPYFGPQWWILPDTVIEEITNIWENKKFCACMRDCYSSDETFFQTAIMIYADRFGITLNEKGYYLNKKWFTIFSQGHPVLLMEEHFDKLKSSKMLFARKFDIEKDSVILDMLDKHHLELLNEMIED